ncbi:hypothetical protein JAAARDRAFT_198971 [Jaapia argillacea MUCL 33604]|uniref:Uncharacterized protein n=1 Tax=Jaapia argillacea MUCL 33604 TaxID=933084 RepID=A0A067PME0_9AGAM|nr:hypothetical protein JAAARDRAFT_198971 [Jaapia argillacea MUCL 33604]
MSHQDTLAGETILCCLLPDGVAGGLLPNADCLDFDDIVLGLTGKHPSFSKRQQTVDEGSGSDDKTFPKEHCMVRPCESKRARMSVSQNDPAPRSSPEPYDWDEGTKVGHHATASSRLQAFVGKAMEVENYTGKEELKFSKLVVVLPPP